MARVKLGFGALSVPMKLIVARWIVSCIDGNPNFPDPQPDIAEVASATDALDVAAQQALRGGTDKTTVKQLAAIQLNELMSRLQDYVQVASGGDPVIIESSGMETRKERTPAIVLGAVQNAEAQVGGNAGEISLNWDRLQGAVIYVIEMQPPLLLHNAQLPQSISADGTDDVLSTNRPIEQQWIQIDTVTKTKLLVKGLITGQVYSFRIAGVNAAGQGNFSQTVSSVAR